MLKGKVKGYEESFMWTVIVGDNAYFCTAECAAGRGGNAGDDNL